MSTIEDRVRAVVCSTLRIQSGEFSHELSAGDIPTWDSLGHVHLLQATEDEFKITFDVGDAIEIESVADLISIVERYLGGAERGR